MTNTELVQGNIRAKNTPFKKQTLTACSILLRGRIISSIWITTLRCNTYYLAGFILVLPVNFAALLLSLAYTCQIVTALRVLHHGQTHSKNIKSYYLPSSFTLLLLSGLCRTASELCWWNNRGYTLWGRMSGMFYYRISHFTTTVLIFSKADQDKPGFLEWKHLLWEWLRTVIKSFLSVFSLR